MILERLLRKQPLDDNGNNNKSSYKKNPVQKFKKHRLAVRA